MRGKSTICVLLIVAIAASASACILGAGTRSTGACPPLKRHCLRAARTGGCGSILSSSPERCGIRGLLQFHFVAFQESDLTGSRLVAGRIAAPFRPALRTYSIGSPETDRGPPRS